MKFFNFKVNNIGKQNKLVHLTVLNICMRKSSVKSKFVKHSCSEKF